MNFWKMRVFVTQTLFERSLRIAWSQITVALVALLSLSTAIGAVGPSKTISLMWQVPADVSAKELDQMKGVGITVIHHFNASRWTEDQLGDYLDRASTHGLRVILYLGSFLELKGNRWTLTKPGMEFIRKWKDHPALYAWHTFDEPIADDRLAYKQAQENVYREVKTVDPKTPVMVSLNLTDGLQWDLHFSEMAFDILELHAYINQSVRKRQENLLANFTIRRRGSYPVIITLRAFNGWTNRANLDRDGIARQHEFFFKKNQVTPHIGFYGWRLGLYTGISQDPALLTQFYNVARAHSRQYQAVENSCAK